jgi:hypothetical protein
MDIRDTDFYYFTLDLNYEDISPCHFVKEFKTDNGREALLVKLEEENHPLGTQYLVIVPRAIDESFYDVDLNELVGAYVVNGEEYLEKDYLEIPSLVGKTIDIGALTPSKDYAVSFKNGI